MREHGVGIIVHDEGDENIGYSVGSADYGGQLHATDGMSLSAWEHEFDHFNYDMELGFPGMGFYLLNPEIRADMEKRAYGLEIDRARSAGYNELVTRLEDNLREELNRIHGKNT